MELPSIFWFVLGIFINYVILTMLDVDIYFFRLSIPLFFIDDLQKTLKEQGYHKYRESLQKYYCPTLAIDINESFQYLRILSIYSFLNFLMFFMIIINPFSVLNKPASFFILGYLFLMSWALGLEMYVTLKINNLRREAVKKRKELLD